jgi:uncharacterized protein (TIGR03435 family)
MKQLSVLIAGILVAPFLQAQQARAPLQFEVASIKPVPASAPYFPSTGGPGTSDPGQITWTGVPLKQLLMTAYAVKRYQISGPAWLDSERFTIVAKVPEGATEEQVNLMWQNLLKERFGMVVHHESRVFQGEEMTLPKGPSKLKETGTGRDELLDRYLPTPDWIFADTADKQTRRFLARALTLQQVASMLDQVAGHPVIDKTGLTRKYDFDVEVQFDTPTPGDGNGMYAIASALEQNYGLKLAKRTVTLDVIVIDHAGKTPVEN